MQIFHFQASGKSGATIGLPTGLGGSYTRGRNIETRELDHTEACPRTAAATDLTDARAANTGVDAKASSLVLKGSYTLPLNFQWPPETIDGAHFKPVHGNRYELKETSEELAQKFRSKKANVAKGFTEAWLDFAAC